MSTALDIRGRAQMFNWDTHTDRHGDTFIHGENMITVDYRRDGAVDVGKRYRFFKITEPRLQETTPAQGKKSTVMTWLTILGS